jgi:ABC-type transport system involved in multi-copper enzyme maturation permease subunit
MKALFANVEDVMREAAARWTLLAYFTLSTIFILTFASAINLDVVNGALAGAKLFGKDVHMRGEMPILQLVLGAEAVFSIAFYVLCTCLAIFATAHLVPRMQEKGTVDLYLSRPVSRTKLLLSRYFAGLILSGTNVFYLIGSVWAIVAWKTHVLHGRFLLAGLLIMFIIATMLAFAFLIGVVTSSTAVSIMMSFGLAVLGVVMYFEHTQFAAAISTQWKADLVHGTYWVVPKVWEIGKAVFAYVATSNGPMKVEDGLKMAPFLSTAAFGVACLALASWLFQRKEF